jgi:hypothetical protein
MNPAGSVSFVLALIILGLPPALAQDHGGVPMRDHSPGVSEVPASPYAGMQKRLVKALSDQQIADLKAGRGMSLALAAELNGYPGPLHVLEMTDALGLSDNQLTRTKALFEAMKAETIPIGERIIADETAFDRLFAERTVTPASLETATSRIGADQTELRTAHLRYHLAMVDVLSPEQIVRYAKLRGYAEPGSQDDETH